MLDTVKVPEQFVTLFEDAQNNVAQYFNDLRLQPQQGKIEVQGSRYVLIRGAAFSVEFFQLVRKLFGEQHQHDADVFSASLLYELAHAIGRSDAKNFHAKMHLEDPIARLSAGPIHFAYSGWAFVDILPESTPSPDEDFCLIYKHPYSFECDAWLESNDSNEHPVCVMNAGYSSGWCQESFGIPLEAREITCRSLDKPDCLFIMAQPHRLQQMISNYLAAHPDIDVCEQHIVFNHEYGPVATDGDGQHQRLQNILQQRLFTYARNLEAAQQQLSDKVVQLNNEIVHRRATEQLLLTSEKRWRELSDTSFDAILICENDQVVSANRASEKLFAIEHQQIQHSTLEQLFPEDCYPLVKQAIIEGKTEISELHLLSPQREKFVDIHIHYSQDDKQHSIILAIRDITERAIAMQRLNRLANYDDLTGLPNRSRFQHIINRALLGRNFNERYALLFLDLDGFKTVNDTLGHSAGDFLLYEVARRMTEAIRGANTICRLGGDEFAIWVPNLQQDDNAAQVAQQVIDALKPAIAINRQDVNITMSIGIAIYPADGTDYSSLISHADNAMYQAKAQGKNQFLFYSETK